MSTIAELVNERLELASQIKFDTTRLADIDAEIVKHVPTGERFELAEGVGVRVQAPSATFSVGRARDVLTPEQFAMISESKPSVALAKQFLPGAILDLCYVPGGKPSVRVI